LQKNVTSNAIGMADPVPPALAGDKPCPYTSGFSLGKMHDHVPPALAAPCNGVYGSAFFIIEIILGRKMPCSKQRNKSFFYFLLLYNWEG